MVTEIKFRIHHQIEDSDGVIMNERTDTINFGDNIVELPEMGIFEFRGGNICTWGDCLIWLVFSAKENQHPRLKYSTDITVPSFVTGEGISWCDENKQIYIQKLRKEVIFNIYKRVRESALR